jgi:murein tripeptide amidase MpaA
MHLLLALAAACSVLTVSPAEARPAPNRQLLGRPVDGRPIYAVEVGDPAAARKVVVVGCVHGDECSGMAITTLLPARRPPPGVDLWIIPTLNPDGAAAGTRGNADGVDLNRNFPWRWQRAGGVFDS